MWLPVPTRAVPIAVGVVVLIADALQFTRVEGTSLACCREAPWGRPIGANLREASGVPSLPRRHGLHRGYCCAGLMARS